MNLAEALNMGESLYALKDFKDLPKEIMCNAEILANQPKKMRPGQVYTL